MWADAKQTKLFKMEKSHMLLNANIHLERYQTVSESGFLETGREKKRQEEGLKRRN